MASCDFTEVPYRPRFRLDYISNVQTGVTTGRYGTGMAGSVTMLFSDILGNSQLFAALALNGEIYDFGGQIAYMNQKNRIKFGTALSHTPYRSAYSRLLKDSLSIGDEQVPVNNFQIDYMRMFRDEVALFTYYPLSQTRRLEAGASLSWYYFHIQRYHNYYTDNWLYIGGDREKIPAPGGFNLKQVDLAYVEDNSFFGITSPMTGHRSRIQLEKYFEAFSFHSLLIDYRKYYFNKPFNLSFRLYHQGGNGRGAENSLMSPLYIGYPWLVRGYEGGTLNRESMVGADYLDINQLTGSRIVVGNLEARLPVTGPEKLSLIPSRWVFADLNLFLDGGLAWNSGETPEWDWQPDSAVQRVPVFSTGLSLRINVFGYLVVEPFYTIPSQNRGLTNGVSGVNFLPGW